KDADNNNLKISHLAGVIIHDFVEVGALNTIVSGTIDPTVIESYTKIDDHVHIAHNCHIHRNCIITAGVVLSGSVTIGENVWIGPNSTVKNSVSIESDNLIGINTLITKSITTKDSVFAGVPGKIFSKFIDEKKAMKYIVKHIEDIKKIT
ncbi:hypothetical protein OAO42_01775, partial [Candidatus Izimaplasma bacterium]|nr:hypothetical protein [Candidatus Izimaplasma bacterium]